MESFVVLFSHIKIVLIILICEYGFFDGGDDLGKTSFFRLILRFDDDFSILVSHFVGKNVTKTVIVSKFFGDSELAFAKCLAICDCLVHTGIQYRL